MDVLAKFALAAAGAATALAAGLASSPAYAATGIASSTVGAVATPQAGVPSLGAVTVRTVKSANAATYVQLVNYYTQTCLDAPELESGGYYSLVVLDNCG
jgi:hypothetical protein